MTSDDLLEAGALIRAYLLPFWTRLHESDLKWGRTSCIPGLPSTAMCRHSSHFANRLLKAAGHKGWMPLQGVVKKAAMKNEPGYARRYLEEVGHIWLKAPDGSWFDLTSDQFGFAPTLAASEHDSCFAGYEQAERAKGLSSITSTIKNWEGDPRGSWQDWELSEILPRYHNLTSRLSSLNLS